MCLLVMESLHCHPRSGSLLLYAVAEFTLRHFPSCALLRRHPVPPPRQFEPLLRAAAAVHVSVDPSTSKVRSCQGQMPPSLA
jgi:exosome complex exonuclease DIS3/RRP44